MSSMEMDSVDVQEESKIKARFKDTSFEIYRRFRRQFIQQYNRKSPTTIRQTSTGGLQAAFDRKPIDVQDADCTVIAKSRKESGRKTSRAKKLFNRLILNTPEIPVFLNVLESDNRPEKNNAD
ncbi:hypothetical protein ACOME3_009669 [Neoechinorhynchus agilis]